MPRRGPQGRGGGASIGTCGELGPILHGHDLSFLEGTDTIGLLLGTSPVGLLLKDGQHRDDFADLLGNRLLAALRLGCDRCHLLFLLFLHRRTAVFEQVPLPVLLPVPGSAHALHEHMGAGRRQPVLLACEPFPQVVGGPIGTREAVARVRPAVERLVSLEIPHGELVDLLGGRSAHDFRCEPVLGHDGFVSVAPLGPDFPDAVEHGPLVGRQLPAPAEHILGETALYPRVVALRVVLPLKHIELGYGVPVPEVVADVADQERSGPACQGVVDVSLLMGVVDYLREAHDLVLGEVPSLLGVGVREPGVLVFRVREQ